MNTRYSRHELLRLLASWCNNTITSQEVDRLEELLLEDPEARQTYMEYAATEAELHSVFADGLLPGMGESSDALTPSSLAQINTENASSLESGAYSPSLRKTVGWMLIAASLVGVAAVSSWVTRQAFVGQPHERLAMGSSEADQNSAIPQAARSEKPGIAVARVTATRNCRWGEPTNELGFHSDLFLGQQIDLLAGVAEITFENGAKVILEGPAKLNLESGHDAVLERGRVAVALPAELVSGERWDHPVRMPRLGIALATQQQSDRGLHYGLSVDRNGHEEVHVFRGDLEAYLLSGEQRSPVRPVLLRPQEAAYVKPASTTLAKFFADKDKFVRSVATGAGPHDGLYAYEGFDYPAGPLSGQNGGFGWAGAWADIEAACPPGEIATNVVEAEGLAYSDQGFRTLGGHATQRAQQNRIRRALSTSLGGVFDTAELVENQDGHRLVGANGKTVYLGFLQRVDRVDDGFYGFELHRGDGNPNRVLCVGNGAEGSGYGVTSNYNSYGKENYARLGRENNDANLIVIKIEYGQQHRDVVTVYRNPESLLDESEAKIDAELRGNFAFDRISFGDFDGQKRHEVDELRVGTTYRAVTGRRDPGAEMISPIIAGQQASELYPELVLNSQAKRHSFITFATWKP